jgi:hypothetical protein
MFSTKVKEIFSVISTNVISTKNLFLSIYKHKQEQLTTRNNVIILAYTITGLVISLSKIGFKKVRHHFDKLKQKSDCTYTYHNKKYKIYIKRQKYYNPKIIEAHDITNNKNIIDRIKEYAGPYENFHNEKITPGNIGYEHIRVTTMIDANISVKEFKKDDIITI